MKFLVLLLAFLLTAPVQAQSTLPVIPVLRTPYTCTVSIMDSTGQVRGTGVYIWNKDNRPLVLTAWHIVNGILQRRLGPVFVGLRRAKVYQTAKILKGNPTFDLALLESKKVGIFKQCPGVRVSNAAPILGSDVWVLGTPHQLELNVTKGVLSNIVRFPRGLIQYRTDAAIFFGNSGGPMLDSSGKLIGIVVDIELRIIPKVSMFVPIIVPGGYNGTSLPSIRRFLLGVPID